MSEYETGTHTTARDRVMVYFIFTLALALTAWLYREYGDMAVSRFVLYTTAVLALPTLWMLAAGHYSRKWCRRVFREEEIAMRPRLHVVPPLREPAYVYRGEVKPLADALGDDI